MSYDWSKFESPKIKVNSDVLTDGKIETRLSIGESVSKHVIDVMAAQQEEAVKKVLIGLGWTPPKPKLKRYDTDTLDEAHLELLDHPGYYAKHFRGRFLVGGDTGVCHFVLTLPASSPREIVRSFRGLADSIETFYKERADGI